MILSIAAVLATQPVTTPVAVPPAPPSTAVPADTRPLGVERAITEALETFVSCADAVGPKLTK